MLILLHFINLAQDEVLHRLSFAILLLFQAFAEATSSNRIASSVENNAHEGSHEAVANEHVQLKKINCNYECSRRCSKALKRKRCKRACKSCCHRCHCVPPGTYGNKNLCPCYARLKTHGNKPKCP